MNAKEAGPNAQHGLRYNRPNSRQSLIAKETQAIIE